MDLMVAVPIAGLSAIVFAVFLAWRVLKKESGTPRMMEIHEAIKIGAVAFLNRQFKTVSIFAIVLTVVLAFVLDVFAALSFAVGATLSALSGYMGMVIAIYSNVRTAQAARKSLGEALTTAFHGGTVMGMMVTGLGLLSIGIMYYVSGGEPAKIVGVGFGASLIALFARIGGGIYTKAADMGADLVGKVEVGIPEDDPQNPAVIADQVGDNVGDMAGNMPIFI